MLINIISLDDGYANTSDCFLLSKFFYKKFKERITLRFYNFNNYKIGKADINVFITYINHYHFKYASTNIYIPSLYKTPKIYNHFFHKFDYILTKQLKDYNFFINLELENTKIINIGWKSKDKSQDINNDEKDFNKFLMIIGNNQYNSLENIIDIWLENQEYPEINIVINKNVYDISLKNISKKNRNLVENDIRFKFHYRLGDDDLKKLMYQCGVHLCINKAFSYNHTVQ